LTLLALLLAMSAAPADSGVQFAQARSASRPGEPTGTIPAVRATVTGLRFFESPQRPTKRHYDDIFFYNAARYIYWELTLSHPALGRQTSFAVEDIWHGPGGDIVHRGSHVFALEGDWTDSFVFAGARKVGTITVDNPVASIPDPACLERNADRRRRNEPEVSCPAVGHGSVDLERWGRGVYQVDILVDKQTVATGRFAMWGKDEIYGEVEEKTRDRALPAGGIAAVNAKVASLRFFETGVDVLPQRDRRYGTRFPLMTAPNVGWELKLSHAVTRQWLPLPIEALLYVTDGQGQRVMQRRVMQSAVPAGWPNTSHVDLFAWDDDYYYQRAGNGRSPGKWLPGSYRVDLYVQNRKIASGAFEVAR
jgi:hypothetical protein